MNYCIAGDWIGLQLKQRSMAILPSLAVPSTPMFRVKLFQCQPCQFHRCSEIYLPRRRSYTRTRSLKVSMADHNEPNEVKMKIGIMREKLKETMPELVQEFPWKKAEHILLERLLNLAQEAVKWSLVLFLIFSFVSDVVYTLSINRELVIPVGLFAGCLVADFVKEISQELFLRSEEKLLKWHLLGMYFIFVFVKIMSSWFATLPRVFLLHVASGGLMQVLWHWRNLIEDAKNQQETSNFSNLETS
ncbi:hypothetical protein PHAVU_001G032000 [Phaseolus vulgaris]|uniref:Uncharacterized protein n=1 Tax=Phaseolus vulgaris TaxID=3885 RepID=V7CRY5_PHAVU|nr:hypothetical protein PHAVU_001G032000g [Phaseolus vulgaris]ESW32957.1 hypothetical protein PHAVU_001G032000g [Phaseolus vulgaris]